MPNRWRHRTSRRSHLEERRERRRTKTKVNGRPTFFCSFLLLFVFSFFLLVSSYHYQIFYRVYRSENERDSPNPLSPLFLFFCSLLSSLVGSFRSLSIVVLVLTANISPREESLEPVEQTNRSAPPRYLHLYIHCLYRGIACRQTETPTDSRQAKREDEGGASPAGNKQTKLPTVLEPKEKHKVWYPKGHLLRHA